MNDKAAFAIKLLFTLAVIAGLCAIVTNSQAEPFELRIVQAKGGLNVREEPNINAKIIYLLEDAETVIVQKWHNGWALVAKNNGSHTTLGWVCGDYLR